jgi:3-oxoacyl-[acyl-carrier-protein] synthase III
MGIVIRSSAASVGSTKMGSAELMAQAAAACILKAGIQKKDIDLLINIGIYHDENIVEPAMAPLVQQKLDLNIHPHAHVSEGGHRTFSFDLMNGSCGFLYAVQVVEALTRSGKVSNALVVSGDMHPSGDPTAPFPFAYVGTAVLLCESHEAGKGFEGLAFRTSPSDHDGMEGFEDLAVNGGHGRDHVTIAVREGYYEELRAFAVDSIRDYMRDRPADRARLKLITSQPQEGFGRSVARAVGFADDAVIDSYGRYGNSHTAALSLGFHVGGEENRFDDGDQLLFVDVGSGMTSALALYNL